MQLPIDYLRGVAIALRKGKQPARWHVLGTGHFSVVYGSPDFPDIVLKISGPAGWGSEYFFGRAELYLPDGNESRYIRRDGWPLFAKFCMTATEDWLPKVYHVEEMSRTLTWGIIEKLSTRQEAFVSCDASNNYEDFFSDVLCGKWDTEDEYALFMFKKEHDLQPDLHDENVMYRVSPGGHKQAVLSDPFSFHSKVYIDKGVIHE